jgi:predicted DNA-binding protein
MAHHVMSFVAQTYDRQEREDEMTKKLVSIRMAVSTVDKMDKIAVFTGFTKAEVVGYAIDDMFEKVNPLFEPRLVAMRSTEGDVFVFVVRGNLISKSMFNGDKSEAYDNRAASAVVDHLQKSGFELIDF